jgi:hypothetical protein
MDQKTTGIVATIATVLLCGCPGLFALFMGAMFSVVSLVPGADIDMLGSADPQSALGFGVGAICLGLLFILIPIVVGFLTLRPRNTGQPGA